MKDNFKNSEKGFTLIELLAVIVILAIVALIATPIILNVINDSRRKAAIDSAYSVIDAAKLAYTQNQTDANAVSASPTLTWPNTITIGSRKVAVSGDKPTGGSLTIHVKDESGFTAGTVVLTNLTFGPYKCNTYDNHTKVCCSETENCTSETS